MTKVLVEKLFVVKVSLMGTDPWRPIQAFLNKKAALTWIKNADRYDFLPGDVFKVVEKTTYEKETK